MLYYFRFGRPHEGLNSYISFADFYDLFEPMQYGVYGILVKDFDDSDYLKVFDKIRNAKVGTEIWYRNGQWECA